jgi:hypothetical protein
MERAAYPITKCFRGKKNSFSKLYLIFKKEKKGKFKDEAISFLLARTRVFSNFQPS